MNRPGLNSWQDIQEEILGRIQSRQWKPGEQIPNEVELAREFGCARATVNRALQAVADQGWIDRRRKAGTRVSMMPVRRARLDIPIIRQQIEESGRSCQYRLVHCGEALPPERLCREMNLVGDLKCIRVVGGYLADHAPFVVEDLWINKNAVPGVADADFSTSSANEWLIQNAPYTRGELAFSAHPAPQSIAGLLEISTGEAVFVMDRLTWRGEFSITSVRLWYAPGYVMTSSL